MPRSIRRLLAGLVTLLLLTSVVPLTAFGEAPPLPESSLETVTPPTETSSALPSESSATSENPSESSAASESSSSQSSVAPPDSNLPLGFSDPNTDGMLAMGLYDYCNVSADVSFDAVNPANGDLIVTLKLEKLDNQNKVTAVWYQTLRYTDGMGSRNFQFRDLRSGRYRLTQLPVMRYTRQKLTNQSVSGNVVKLESYSVTFNLWLAESSSYAAFHNKRTTDKWFTHTDMVVNRIYLPAQGGVCNDVP